MKWKQPSVTKIYEALGAVADGRVEVQGSGAKVTSSSGNKAYDVSYDAAAQSIMANDNASYYQGYLGYPAIAYLMIAGVISYDHVAAQSLAGVAWKDLNQSFKNDFDAAVAHVMESKTLAEHAAIEKTVQDIASQLTKLDLHLLGAKSHPPEGY